MNTDNQTNQTDECEWMPCSVLGFGSLRLYPCQSVSSVVNFFR